ncbi:hypothetical protein PanWU01x14_246710 [Parasponia andersonii]|uniref:Transcription factor tau subunit sfc3/Tfc3 C-terminal domain-containing protein n=1 Tax=Parasponia andersonii TaxID=3476 RepID=A0A2P5BE39_PARAD|nr:hypothetical protein PanWU01x14_246710 [Parasponia andersonii]
MSTNFGFFFATGFHIGPYSALLVLRVYYDKRQLRLHKLSVERNDFQTLRSSRVLSSQRRERSPDGRSVKFRKVVGVTGQLDEQRLDAYPVTGDQFMEGETSVPSAENRESNLQAFQDDENHRNEGDPELNEDDEGCYSVITRSAFSKMKATRQRRFSWTEEADRQLVIQYARHRAAVGVKVNRTDWASVPDLPAPPSTCRKRMASLNSNVKFRKAVMRLCNMLSERYVKLLEKTQNKLLEKDDNLSQGSLSKGLYTVSSGSNEHAQETGFKEEPWDDFDNTSIKVALDEVLRCKWMAKLEASKRVGSSYEEWSDLKMNAEKHESEVTAGTTPGDVQNFGGRQQKISMRRSRAQRLHKKFIDLLNEEVKVSRQVYKSLAISNAVELFKLIFLSTSTAPTVPNMLAEILRRYSEHDLFAAFNYLREKRNMVGGNGSQPFSLSQQFMHNVSKSSFPTNSGLRASKFANWLHEREKDLTRGIDLTADLQCGDIFHLFALVSSGQLSLSPCLPDEGVGEAEDTRSLKRKIDNYESSDGDKSKKLKSLVAAEGEIISRREKGFPGIAVSIQQTAFSTADVVELFKAEDTCAGEAHNCGNDIRDTISGPTSLSDSDHVKEILNSDSNISIVENISESPWIAMAGYAASLLSIHSDLENSSPIDPEVFRAVYTAIRKAGDQGLSIDEVSQLINTPGEKNPEIIVSVLQTFGRVLKVNAFDSVHVIDALYRSKYFLTSAAVMCQDLKAPSGVKTIQGDNSHLSGGPHTQEEANTNADDVHTVSILNFPEEITESFNENQTKDLHEVCIQGRLILSGGDKEDEPFKISSGELCVPILPWINGDGTINKAVYKGLRRRVIGIVMQNPGILEDEIINRMDVLNPQSCRKLLELMILDKHLIVRKMQQTASNVPPPILGTLFRSGFSKSKLVCRDHFFANPTSTFLL